MLYMIPLLIFLQIRMDGVLIEAHGGSFDAGSFIGGIVAALAVMASLFFIIKFYTAKKNKSDAPEFGFNSSEGQLINK